MPQEDNETAELEHAEEIALVIFPAADESAEIVEPGKEALDFPAPTVAPQFAAVLGALAAAVVLVGRDEPDAVFLPEALIERIAADWSRYSSPILYGQFPADILNFYYGWTQ
jgi:hypothetical protein